MNFLAFFISFLFILHIKQSKTDINAKNRRILQNGSNSSYMISPVDANYSSNPNCSLYVKHCII